MNSFICVSVSQLVCPSPPPPPLHSCFSCLLNRDVLMWGPRLCGHKGASLWCFWSAARSDMSTVPQCVLQWLIMQHGAKDAHPLMFPLLIIRAWTHMQTWACFFFGLRVGSALGGVALSPDTRERKWDGVCDFFPTFLPFFFAFDSKMDDCNHRSHQWDRAKVYRAGRHSHGKPAVRLMCHAAMGTMHCLFVWGVLLFHMHFLTHTHTHTHPPSISAAFSYTLHESLLIKHG